MLDGNQKLVYSGVDLMKLSSINLLFCKLDYFITVTYFSAL
jgi:hypothetical protein